nr:unnamed protein product [Digitaria exilis]
MFDRFLEHVMESHNQRWLCVGKSFVAKAQGHAIRFVLSDMFQNLRRVDRGALLHEGAGHSVVSAFVEIVFDNTDNRIPVDKEEKCNILLPSQDLFVIIMSSKTEVMNLLESAGFSRSNPYYVVQQGKIASLTLMKDSERLDLLKEIGGTRVYEDRRCESLKIMKDTADNRRKHIDKVVDYLEERLRELDEEKEELRKYQQLDKQRRSIEYTILDHELNDARNELSLNEDNRRKISENMYHADIEMVEVCKRIKSCDKGITVSSKGINDTMAQNEGLEMRITEALEVVAQIEFDLRDIKDRIVNEKQAKDEATRDLQSMRREIEKSISEMAEISDVHKEILMQEAEISRSIMDHDRQLSILYQKQGRATQFANKADRDDWLQKEIKDLEAVLLSNTKQESTDWFSVEIRVTFLEIWKEGLLHEEIQNLRDGINNLTNNIESWKSDSSKLEAALVNIPNQYKNKTKERDELQEKRKSIWKDESDLTTEINRLQEDLIKAQKGLDHAMPGV